MRATPPVTYAWTRSARVASGGRWARSRSLRSPIVRRIRATGAQAAAAGRTSQSPRNATAAPSGMHSSASPIESTSANPRSGGAQR